jgi:hypothetical protein
LELNKVMDRPLLEDFTLTQEAPNLEDKKEVEAQPVKILDWRNLVVMASIALALEFGKPLLVHKGVNLLTDVYSYFSNKPKTTVQFDIEKFLSEECYEVVRDGDLKEKKVLTDIPFRTPLAPQYGIMGRYIAYSIAEDGKSLEYFGIINGDGPLNITSRENALAGECGEYDVPIYQSSERSVHHLGKQYKAMLKETYSSYFDFPFYKFLLKAQLIGAGTKEDSAVYLQARYDPKKHSFTSPNFTNETSPFKLIRHSTPRDKRGKPYKVELLLIPDSFYDTQ